MKSTKKVLAVLLAFVLVLGFVMAGCNPDSTPGTTNPSITPSTPTDPSNPTNPSDPTNPSNPTDPSDPSDPTDPTLPPPPVGDLQILVVPELIEIYAGEEIDLMLGIVVNEGARVIILDDSDFDNETPGTYEITYQATLNDQKVTGTRTIVVLEALSNIALEVRNNYLGENKWQGKLISFANGLYVQLTQNTELKAQSGVFHNTSDKAIVLTVAGTYGCSAILDKNGVVIEGRDGANSKLVNTQYPVRTGTPLTTMVIGGETVNVSAAFAKEMTIPAGGFAVVIQANYAGVGADADGRGFMNYNVIYEVGNVVRLFWVDTNETLTPYVNQKPTVSGNTKLLVQQGDADFDLDTAVLAGLIAKDDKGTFDPADDVTLDAFNITNKGGFDISKAGTYTITITISDGKLTNTFTREVEVKSDGLDNFFIGENKLSVVLANVAKNKELSSVGTYSFIIYTSSYKGTIGFANGHGEAIVVNKYGEIVRIYDGANAKYYDKANVGGVQNGTCTATGYYMEAFESLQDGETLIIAPHTTTNSAAGGSRHFLLNNRTIGAIVSGLGLSFETKEDGDPCANGHSFVNGVCGNCGEADPDYDPCAEGHNYVNGICSRCDAEDPDYVVPDDSKTITIGDKTFVSSNWAYNDASVIATNVATYTMVIYDKYYTDSVSLNGYGVALVLNKYGQLVKIYDAANGGFWTVAGKSTATLTFNSNNYATVAFSELAEGELLVIFPNDGGANGNAARGWALGLRSTNYLGETATLTGFEFETHPCADGHNFVDGECEDCGEADPDFDPCADGHNFVDGECKDCGEADPDYVAPGESKTITIGTKSPLTVADGKWTYNNANITTGNAATYSLIIFDEDFTGSFTTNAYGVALVVNKYGELVKIYDGANGQFWTADGKAATPGFTVNDYATVAYAALEEGEMLLIFPNDGGSNTARNWANGLRNAPSGPSECGKVITLTGFTFETKPSDDKTITIGTKSPLTVVEGKWTYNNANITTGNAATYSLIIFDEDFTGSFTTNGYGVALVVNKYGELVKIYDGANGQFWTADGKAATPGFTVNDYATVAYAALEEGEMLLIFPNDGGSNTARNWANGLRNAPSGPSECGKVITLTGFEFEVKPSDDKTITIGTKSPLTVVEGKWTYNNANITTGNAATYSLIIFDEDFTGSFTTNGYGVALVVNKYGELVKIYDGANGQFWTADGKAATPGFTVNDYATVAYAALEEGEMLLIFPNDGGSNTARNWANGLRNAPSGPSECGKVITLTGFEFESKDKTLTVDDKSFTAVNGKWAYNDSSVDKDNAANYSMIIYDGNFEGTVSLNGYGVALVLNQYGELVKIYDGANVGFWTVDGKADTAGFTASNYSAVAFLALAEGETLIIFPNDGGSNAARGWALGLRSTNYLGKVATLTGFTFATK